MEEQNNKKKNGKRHLLIGTVAGLGLISLGFGWWYFFGRKKHSQETEDQARKMFDVATSSSENDSTNKPTNEKHPSPPAHKAEHKQSFPIKYGDKGALVKQLQEGLIKMYGQKILQHYGADGDFKKELQKALASKGYPTTIDRETFNKIVSGEENISSNPIAPGRLSLKEGVDIARNIWLNAMLHKNEGMVGQLQRIRNTEDYKMVDALMKTVGQKKPLADVSLFAATDETGHELIVSELKRIGLKYREEKWVLAGLNRAQLITNSITTIRDKSGLGIEVPEETMLGEVISTMGTVTSFRTIDDQVLYVPTKNTYHV